MTPISHPPPSEEGITVVFYGSGSGLIPPVWERFSQGTAGASREADDHFGASLTAGDFDGDNYSDLAIGTPGEDFGDTFENGMVILMYGSSSGLVPARYSRIAQSRIGGIEEFGDGLGTTLAAGDFDNNGQDDLVMGAPWRTWRARQMWGRCTSSGTGKKEKSLPFRTRTISGTRRPTSCWLRTGPTRSSPAQ